MAWNVALCSINRPALFPGRGRVSGAGKLQQPAAYGQNEYVVTGQARATAPLCPLPTRAGLGNMVRRYAPGHH